jgi:hypothetical protein
VNIESRLAALKTRAEWLDREDSRRADGEGFLAEARALNPVPDPARRL